MENKKLIYWILGIIIIVGFVMLLGTGKNTNISPDVSKESATSVYTEGVLDIVENNFDFGTILMGGGVVTNKFKIINNSESAVKIEKVYTSCACTTAYIVDESGEKIGKFGMPGHKGLRTSADIEVLPGESVVVETTYDPVFHGPAGVGLAQRSVYIETNSKVVPKLELKFQAMVTR